MISNYGVTLKINGVTVKKNRTRAQARLGDGTKEGGEAGDMPA